MRFTPLVTNGLWLWRAVFASTYHMSEDFELELPADLVAEWEYRYFWWEPIGLRPRSAARLVAQVMDLASFKDVRRLESVVRPNRLAEILLSAEPGWISDRSWEFWRGRLSRATGYAIPDKPPRRSFDAGIA
jgi:hypothetical protein